MRSHPSHLRPRPVCREASKGADAPPPPYVDTHSTTPTKAGKRGKTESGAGGRKRTRKWERESGTRAPARALAPVVAARGGGKDLRRSTGMGTRGKVGVGVGSEWKEEGDGGGGVEARLRVPHLAACVEGLMCAGWPLWASAWGGGSGRTRTRRGKTVGSWQLMGRAPTLAMAFATADVLGAYETKENKGAGRKTKGMCAAMANAMASVRPVPVKRHEPTVMGLAPNSPPCAAQPHYLPRLCAPALHEILLTPKFAPQTKSTVPFLAAHLILERLALVGAENPADAEAACSSPDSRTYTTRPRPQFSSSASLPCRCEVTHGFSAASLVILAPDPNIPLCAEPAAYADAPQRHPHSFSKTPSPGPAAKEQYIPCKPSPATLEHEMDGALRVSVVAVGTPARAVYVPAPVAGVLKGGGEQQQSAKGVGSPHPLRMLRIAVPWPLYEGGAAGARAGCACACGHPSILTLSALTDLCAPVAVAFTPLATISVVVSYLRVALLALAFCLVLSKLQADYETDGLEIGDESDLDIPGAKDLDTGLRRDPDLYIQKVK
ncbi:hypothetical protein B0H11DRAFT_2422070 [Mycena galericulata]|nr:hypothetical protein B0H11DRAFT_2422070 [Mycena galericulata]